MTLRLIRPSVSLEYATPEGLIATAARASYQSYDKQSEESDARLISYFRDHNESPLEFGFAAFSVTCSYAAHVHFLRHRHLSQSWLSQRYTEALGVTIPGDLELTPYALKQVTDAWHASSEVYQTLRNEGFKKQDARYVMPQAATMQGWIAGNPRAWLGMLALRTSKKAMPETRALARMMRKELSRVWPTVFPDA